MREWQGAVGAVIRRRLPSSLRAIGAACSGHLFFVSHAPGAPTGRLDRERVF
jgi:hypothetical protein